MMKNGCTATIQAVKVGGQHPGNKQVRLQDERQLTRSYFSVSGGIVEELSIEVPEKWADYQQYNIKQYVNQS
ncbi:hypothetical protein TNCV_1204701 [Trichonephila clavipes]|nr:hypothetical protein TNCV_1204701 [Trichonephila clavipes]